VQVDLIIPMLKPPGTKVLKLKCDTLVSTSAFKFNLRRYMMGRSLTNSLYNLEVKGTFSEALKQLGYNLENLVSKERDAALGNGGLGRLAVRCSLSV